MRCEIDNRKNEIVPVLKVYKAIYLTKIFGKGTSNDRNMLHKYSFGR